MQKINFNYYNTNTNKNETLENAIVASTKTLNILVRELEANKGFIIKTSTIKATTFYLDRDKALEYAQTIARDLGLENNEFMINHIMNAFETACIVKREK